MDDRERRIRQRLKNDFPHYAERCLKVRTKSGEVLPFRLNGPQRYLHERLEQQRRETGKVRALILKGRQQGVSTYISGRYYHKVSHRRGCRVFILTHEQEATENLFGMAERYHDLCPSLVKPATQASNAKELSFGLLDSGYRVGTAGTKAVGRSQTIQLFHGSEVAFWPHAGTHFAGVVQAVPDLPGTEVLLESTANGVGGEFHERWQQAEAGDGDFIPVFIPWFWSEEYQRAVPEGFILTDDEREYAEAYGLSKEQMVWRRAKIADLKDPDLFKQEYPATASEAFQNTGHDSFIKAPLVVQARKGKNNPLGVKVLGVDPARFGDDRFSIAVRQGRVVSEIVSKSKIDVVSGANWTREMIREHKPAKAFVDVGGLGAGIVDILHSWGGETGPNVVVPVNFGSAPMEPEIILPDGEKRPGPRNRRAEMWMRSRDWLMEPGGATIPDDDALQADACGPGYKYDANQRLVLEGKEEMRKRGIRSPDEWDAVALTFAEPVHDKPAARDLRVPSLGVV